MAEMKRKYTHYEKTENPEIVFKEKGRKMTFHNPKKRPYERVHVDGEEITSGERCDYMLAKYDYATQGEPFVNPKGSHEEYFVELKGTSIAKAVSQLEATIKCLSVDANGLEKFAFVIGTGVGSLPMTKSQTFGDKFKRKYKASLIIRERKYFYKLN